jgi:hypothetical protein
MAFKEQMPKQQQQQKHQCTVGPLIYENCQFLKLLIRTKSVNKRAKILKNMTNQQLLALSEICLNILTNKFQLTTRQKQRMQPYADFIRQQGRIRSESGARRLILKRGGKLSSDLFPAILTPIIKHICKYGK